MMTLNPAQRPQIDEINAHPWMQGSVPSEEEIKANFAERKNLVDMEAHNEREAKRKQRHEAANARNVRRGGEHNEEEGETVENPTEAWKNLEIEEYGPYFVQDYMQFFITSDPMDYFDELVIYLQAHQVAPNISGSKLKLNFIQRIGGTAGSGAAEEAKEDEGKNVKVDIQVL